VDVREHGSHNAGATNTFRVLGPKAGVPVLLIDILKGFLPVRLLPNFTELEPDTAPWMWFRVALVSAAVIGHLYPVFAGFKGGKGVATSLGGVLAVHPGAAAICVAVFAVVFLLSRYVSLGSLCAAVAFPIGREAPLRGKQRSALHLLLGARRHRFLDPSAEHRPAAAR
jgi:glycerol-3-phosphate acyltransferase PlsY